MSVKPAQLYWKPGDPRPHEDEEPFADVFRKKVNEKLGYNLKDWWELHDWSTSKTNEFLDFIWDYFNVIGDRGDGPAFVEGIPMDEEQQYFPGARLNVAENLLLSHASAMSKTTPAMIATVEADPFSSQPTQPFETRRVSYFELYNEVNRCAQALRKLGIKPGDSVGSFAATSCEMLTVFLATVSIGAIFSSTPAEFGVKAVVDRYSIIKPKVLFTIDKYRYAGSEHDVTERSRKVVEELRALGPELGQVVVVGHLNTIRTPAPDTLKGYPPEVNVSDWHAFMATGNDCPAKIPFYRAPFNHPIWIVFSSGTTGKPKSIYGPGGGIMLMRKLVFGVHGNVDHRDAYLQFATMGWIVWNMHVMFLVTGGTAVAYDGSPFHPAGSMWNVIERYRVSFFGASPRYIQTLNQNGFKPTDGRDLSCLKQIYCTGAPVTQGVYDFCENELNRIFVNNAAGGTELGGSALQSTHVLPMYKGELQTPVLGINLIAAGPNGESLVGEEGTEVFAKPFPNMPYYFVDDPGRKRYKETYFGDYKNPPMFNMNDSVIINPKTKGWTVIGRADGVLNPSGVRFGSSELYYVLEKKFAREVEDSIAVGQRMPDGNERVILFVKTRDDVPLSAELVREIKAAIAEALSRRHVPSVITQCPQVPITASGKKVEPSIKKILNGVPLSQINLAGVVNPDSYKFYAEWTKANPPRKSKL